MFEFVPSVGNSGGLLTAWMSSVFMGVSVFSESFALGVRLTSTQSDDTWTLVTYTALALIPTELCLLHGSLISKFQMGKIG
mgnify:CR=1 FL=1